MHDSTTGTYSTLVLGLIDAGIQLFAAPACGHTVISFSRDGIRFGSIVFAPVFGSMPVMMFCRPRSIENRYLPLLSRSSAS